MEGSGMEQPNTEQPKFELTIDNSAGTSSPEVPQQNSQETQPVTARTPENRRAEGERLARQEIGAAFAEKMGTIEERLRQDPSFEAQGTKFEIKGPGDYLVGRAQAGEKIAKELLEGVRGKEYFKEEAAAKLEAFANREAELAKLYVEVKEYHPELAEALEKVDPTLAPKYESAKQSFENLKKPA